ncbi:hypothetical protein K9O30_02160 [Clostridium bowmanii]|uniref:hypothetical protein n=1 Tax=Clostridium bowmanii TaxID=132925 RepID=UPI001C0D6259|nr:hypothetical protein [Clostridium bowmanii]MBU3190666.1 hypothetical protein [Clostridium bowmanii]MCA1072562.1 hypothetical protein [Clostridium bowmanii]
MNKFIDWIISSLKYMCKKNKSYLIEFYNDTKFLINKHSTLNKLYNPIISEKIDINKSLQETLKILKNKNSESKSNILKLESKNKVIQSKISIIQELLTKRHD